MLSCKQAYLKTQRLLLANPLLSGPSRAPVVYSASHLAYSFKRLRSGSSAKKGGPSYTPKHDKGRVTRNNSPSQTYTNSKPRATDFALSRNDGIKADNEFSEMALKRIRAESLDLLQTKDARDRCTFVGVPDSIFIQELRPFVDDVLSDKVPGLSVENIKDGYVRDGTSGVDTLVIPSFIQYLVDKYPGKLERLNKLRSMADLRNFHEFYPKARRLKRKIIMHVGPTNSGKTYNALKRLEEAKTGIYCSPLRLLAHEIYTRLNKSGNRCMLVTGEDRRDAEEYDNLSDYPINEKNEILVPKVSSTIEMINLNNLYDVAVIDEIQMIQDPQRGWAWTNAVLGVFAKEVHLCGEETAVPLIKKLLELTGDEIEVKSYKRLNELVVADQGLSANWTKIKEGDCVVTFSRKKIFSFAKAIEAKAGFKCAVIYGGLPPENRALQAKLFNTPGNEYKVLVASDAVGMGLNLRINRVIIESIRKYDGVTDRRLTLSQLKQISGRAGRYNVTNEVGEVTTLFNKDLPIVKKLLPLTPDPIKKAGVIFPREVLEKFAYHFPENQLSKVLTAFMDCAIITDNFFMCNVVSMKAVSQHLSKIPLSFRQYHTLLYAPIPHRNETTLEIAKKYAKALSKGKQCKIAECMALPAHPPTSKQELENYEALHRAVLLYLWLSFQAGAVFNDIENVFAYKTVLERGIQSGLDEHEKYQ